MAVTKRTTHKSTRPIVVRRPQVVSSYGPNYDTMLIVTILLLIFVYPVGLIVMWSYMRQWPVLLKIVISLPLIISLLFVLLIVIIFGSALKNHTTDRMHYRYRYGMQNTPTVLQQNY